MRGRNPLRVLYIDHVPRLSGAEQSLLDLVVGLAKGPVEPVVVLPGDGPLATQLRAEGVLVRMVPMSRRMLETSRRTLRARPFVVLARLWAFLVASWRIYRIVREMRPDVIHTNTLKAHLLAVFPAMLSRTPLVWHVRDILPKGWLRRAFVFWARVPALIVVPSRSVARGFGKRNKTIQKKLRLIPNGVRVDELSDPDAGRALRAEVGAEGGTLVGIVGRIAPWKGQETFIRAAAMLADRYPKARFAVIGAVLFPENDAPFQRKLQDLVAEAGLSDRIVFLGWRTTAEAMSALDVLVHASTEPEPFGRAVIEAMAAGVPVIASNSGAMREILPPTAGMLIPAGRPEILADALDTLLADRSLRQEMGESGMAIAHNFFDVRRTVAGVGAMYGELARGRSRRRAVEREPRRRSRMRNRPIAWPQAPEAQPEPVAAAAGPRNGHSEARNGNGHGHGRNGSGNGNGRLGNGKGNGHHEEAPAAPEAPEAPERPARRGARRSDVRRLVARIPSRTEDDSPARHVAERRPQPETLPEPEATPSRAARPAAARAVPALKPKVAPRRNGNGKTAPRPALPQTDPATLTPPAPLRRESPVPVERAAKAVPMRVAPTESVAPEFIPLSLPARPLYDRAKRILDLTVALAVLIIGAPVWLLVALLIKLDSRGPVFFRNTVIGKDGVPFTYYKFRSMRVDMSDDEHRAFIARYVAEHTDGTEECDERIYKLVNDRRVTGVGRFIRKLSFDEVPQLVNVVRGEMSIVGPRPPLVYEYELYDGWAKQRLAVLPGLTGLQQVEARHTASFRDKIEMDLDYIRRRSLGLDFAIMVKSIPAALKGE